MKNKKIITVIATVAVLSTLIVSCGKSENDESKTANSTNTVTSTDTATSNNSKEDSKKDDSKENDSKENDSKDKEQSEDGKVITANSDEELKFDKVDVPENLAKDNAVDNMNYLTGKLDTKISIDELQASLFDLVGESGVTNREILLKNENQADGDTLVVLFSEKDNKNIKLYDVDEEKLENKISEIEKQDGIVLDEMQHKAVIEAVKKGLLIITGGPGTGKTTTIETIIHYFESEGMDLYLAAPTGRAAKRMTETTGYEAQTLHRLLELSGGLEGDNRVAEFGRNEQNPLEADVIIVDETSMVDMYLMNYLLKAVLVGTRLIFVGDVNQLPSVGPGCVLKDMIDSQVLPVVRLTKIFRQAMESDIVKNAHKINRGEEVDLQKKDSRDFFFIHQNDQLIMQRAILSLVQDKLPRFVNATPLDIQVLTPMRKGVFGVYELNKLLQKYLNPPAADKYEKELPDRLFREGDKVMQTKNNYQLEWKILNRYNVEIEKGMGVFNGDIGVISRIDENMELMTVVFDENRQVDYPFKLLDELELAYAITVHKSQGSEYPAVVMPMFQGPRPLMNRNLLYTAVTRAKNCVALVGSATVFNEMVENENEHKRYSGLQYLLKNEMSM